MGGLTKVWHISLFSYRTYGYHRTFLEKVRDIGSYDAIPQCIGGYEFKWYENRDWDILDNCPPIGKIIASPHSYHEGDNGFGGCAS